VYNTAEVEELELPEVVARIKGPEKSLIRLEFRRQMTVYGKYFACYGKFFP